MLHDDLTGLLFDALEFLRAGLVGGLKSGDLIVALGQSGAQFLELQSLALGQTGDGLALAFPVLLFGFQCLDTAAQGLQLLELLFRLGQLNFQLALPGAGLVGFGAGEFAVGLEGAHLALQVDVLEAKALHRR